MNDYAIEAVQITKSYGSVLALDQVNLHVRTGSIYGLIGDNGAGKQARSCPSWAITAPGSPLS